MKLHRAAIGGVLWAPSALLAILAILALGASGCEGRGAGSGGAAAAPEVAAYVSLDSIFSDPILADFEKAAGIRVLARHDSEAEKTTAHTSRLLALRDRQEADVFWNNEVVRSIALQRAGVLEPYRSPAAADIPAAYKDPDGHWTGFAARARVILYNTDRVKATDAPRSMYDFLKPEWRGRFAIARPLFGTTSTHAAALVARLGREKARALMAGWVANDCRVVPGNGHARNLVMDGHMDACLTDTDDANGAFLQGKPVEMVYPDQGDGELGALVIPNTVCLIRGGPNPERGKRLIDHLLSREVEARLARIKGAQMPLRPGIAPHSERFDLSRIKPMAVDWQAVAGALDETTALVREVFEK